VVGLVSLVLGAVLLVGNRGAGYTAGVFSYSDAVRNLATTIAFLVMGAVLVSRRPGNSIGWLCLGSGVFGCVGWPALQYAGYVLITHPGSLAGGGLALAIPANGSFAPALVFLIFIVLLFPTGQLISARWRPVAWLTVISFAGLFSIAAVSSLDPPFQHYENPIRVSGGVPVLPVLAVIGGLGSVGATFASVVVRFRRSRRDERAQLKWLAFAASALPIALIAHTVAESQAPGAVKTIEALFSISIMGLPVAIGIAILKYRLYAIDRLISRTLSYLIITGLLVGVFVGIVALATQVLPFSSPVAVAASTLAAAALFNPLRVRVQRLVDRRFNRARYDAEAIVAAFTLQLRDAVDLDTVRDELLLAVNGAVQPAHASVWLRSPS
jgi:hypothetical protein